MAPTRRIFCLAVCVSWIVVSMGPASTETTTHFPAHDTYVRGGSYADRNYDSDSKLRVKNASGESNDRHTLVRFDLSGESGIPISATLNLYCVGLTNGTPSAAFVYSVADDTWQEDTVTWDTAPAAGSLLDSRTDITTVGATYSFDVTAFVAQELAGDGMVSLLLRDDIEVNKAADFGRREGSNPPTLVIETQDQFLLAVTPSGSGQVTLAPPGGAYDAGTQVVLTALADSGWQFISWSGDLSGAANPTSVTMDADKSIVAHFQPRYTLSLSVNGLGSVTLDPPGGSYAPGTDLTLTAVPAPSWSFAGWSGDLAGAENPIIMRMDADRSAEANFTTGPLVAGQIVFQEDRTGGASSSASVSTSTGLLGASGDLYLAAIASKPFRSVTGVTGLGLSWTLAREQCSGDGTTGLALWLAQGQTAGIDRVSAQLASSAEQVAIVALRYAGVDSTQPLGGIVSGNTNGVDGSCSGGSDSNSYSFDLTTSDSGATVFGVTAHLERLHTPGSGWSERKEFHQGSSGSEASIAVVEQDAPLPGSISFSGSFSGSVDWAALAVELRPALESTLQLSTTGLGTLTLDPPGGTYPVETIVSINATPEPGWWFVEWGLDVGGSTNPTSVLIESQAQVSAVFSSVPHYDLIVTANGVGNVTVDPPEHRYAAGTPITLTADIPIGWIFNGWSGDASGNAASTTIVMSAQGNVTADFSFVGPGATGLWTSAAELSDAPLQGDAWDAVVAAADEDFFPPDVTNLTSSDNIRCLAAAIVHARSGEATYCDRVIAALEALPSLGNPGSTPLVWAREVGAYALAADLVGYRSVALDNWFRNMAETYVADNGRTVLETFHQRPNNWGTHAFGMLVSVYAYLQDEVMLDAVREYWVAGVQDTPADAVFGELSWHPDPARPLLINAARSTKQGLDIDGVIADDMRRGGLLANPPNWTTYAWEGLQGLVMAARILERYDPHRSIWYVGEKAIYRAARLLQERWEQQFGGWAAAGDDMWMLPFLDRVYGTSWATGAADEWRAGKNVGWAYVLLGSGGGTPSSTTIPDTRPFRLYPGFPNPFTASTRIRFSLPAERHVRIGVYDVRGRRVVTLFDGVSRAGLHQVQWQGHDAFGRPAANGIYWCQLEAGSQRERVRIILIR
ncbi:MAG: T9SS type A sorting domain-containing protein [Candidatus Latescibacterota bacterium]|nr:MAG: T9SS type A sorting domain-containing protein [Candidatus Latescibacterota bacterium]